MKSEKKIVIGDIHGRDIWRKILKGYSGEEIVVFMGDYFDTFEFITTAQQIKNFKGIVALKAKYPEKVKLLIGNHDYHYLPGVNGKYSGYQVAGAQDIQNALVDSLKFLQMCYVNEYKVFTHAGVTKTWCRNNGINPVGNIENQINKLFAENKKAFEFCVGAIDPSGDDPMQSPIWVRPGSLIEDYIPDATLIVGHTQVDRPRIKFPIVMVDTLATKIFVEIDNRFKSKLCTE